MKIIRGKRGSGKTRELILESHRTGKTILCINSQRKEYIMDFADKLRLKIREPFTVHEEQSRSGVHWIQKGVLVDDLREVLEYYIKEKVLFATTSSKVTEIDNEDDNINNKTFQITLINNDVIKTTNVESYSHNLQNNTVEFYKVDNTGGKEVVLEINRIQISVICRVESRNVLD